MRDSVVETITDNSSNNMIFSCDSLAAK